VLKINNINKAIGGSSHVERSRYMICKRLPFDSAQDDPFSSFLCMAAGTQIEFENYLHP